jgi:hypothetical protein
MEAIAIQPAQPQAKQSSDWDDMQPLAEMLAQAKYFVLTTNQPHGDLVEVVLGTYLKNGKPWLDCCALSHDSEGVTCESRHKMAASMIDYWMERGQAVLTKDHEEALHYIWQVMNCDPDTYTRFSQS